MQRGLDAQLPEKGTGGGVLWVAALDAEKVGNGLLVALLVDETDAEVVESFEVGDIDAEGVAEVHLCLLLLALTPCRHSIQVIRPRARRLEDDDVAIRLKGILVHPQPLQRLRMGDARA